MFAPKLLVKNKHNQQGRSHSTIPAACILGYVRDGHGAVEDLDGVLGFQMMNEPHRGYINVPSLHAFDYNTDLHLSHVPSAFESFQLGAGHPTLVSTWMRSFPIRSIYLSHTLRKT
ncbi:hypothetical protein BDZ97DRAFT_635755 [Flammula alnicola]|nr:hypothetical protein BDZ97DRAFT_635755 [Flammula alnicola]